MTATKHNLIREDQIRANERCVTCRDACTERFVVRVAEAHDCANVIPMLATYAANLEKTKVALPVAVQSMMLLHNVKRRVVVDSRAKLRNQSIVSNWSPAIRSLWSFHSFDFIKVALL